MVTTCWRRNVLAILITADKMKPIAQMFTTRTSLRIKIKQLMANRILTIPWKVLNFHELSILYASLAPIIFTIPENASVPAKYIRIYPFGTHTREPVNNPKSNKRIPRNRIFRPPTM